MRPALPAATSGSAIGRLVDWLADVRNTLAASPKFQRLAILFPPTRPIAHAKARQLFDLVAGFVYSQILFALVKLDVPGRLAHGPMSLSALAQSIDVPEAGTRRLVEAAVALRLLAWRSDGRVALGELGAALAANPGVAAMVSHHGLLYADLADPVALLRGEPRATALSAYWPYATAAEPGALAADVVAPYCDLMGASQALIAGEVLDAYDVGRHRHLLDIGGGDGTFCLAAAGRAPALEITLFDLPAVAERAQARFETHGIARRARAVGGDFDRTPLPRGADLVSLVRVLYDHNDDKALRILKAARAAVAPGGHVIIAEPMAKAKGAETVGDAYFGLYLLAMGSGRARSPSELIDLVGRAGFTGAKIVGTRMPLQTGLITARA
ncbi:MAG: methyltransferase [Hyphomicrobiaceae bacterium]|nr:methyltransferase [Hyphomicrobiaceae bacterium]